MGSNLQVKNQLKLLRILLVKDLKLEFRHVQDVLSIILFDLLSVLIFSLAYFSQSLISSMPLETFIVEVWVIIFFTVLFVIQKIFAREKESGTLTGQLASPLPVNILYLSKIIYTLLFTFVLEVILIVFALLFSVPSNLVIEVPWGMVILLAIVLPTIDLSITGTLISAFLVYAKSKAYLIPILFFPILLPIVSPIISISLALLGGEELVTVWFEVLFLILHSIFMGSIAVLIGEKLLSE